MTIAVGQCLETEHKEIKTINVSADVLEQKSLRNQMILVPSVADPGCLSRIRIRPFFSIPDPDPTVIYPGSGSGSYK
jgi:hypothetical protein